MVTQQAFSFGSGVSEVSANLASAASVVMLAAPGVGYTHRIYDVVYTYNGTYSLVSLLFGATPHFVLGMGPVANAPTNLRCYVPPSGLDVGDDTALSLVGAPNPDAVGVYCTVVYETILSADVGRPRSSLLEVSLHTTTSGATNILAVPTAQYRYRLHGMVLTYGGAARTLSLRYGSSSVDHFKVRLGPVTTESTFQEFRVYPPGIALAANQKLDLFSSGLLGANGADISVVYEKVRVA